MSNLKELLSDPRYAVTGRVRKFMEKPDGGTLPASCTIHKLQDSSVASMQDLFNFAQTALITAAGVNCHLDGFNTSSWPKKNLGKLSPTGSHYRVQDSMQYDENELGSWSIVETSGKLLAHFLSGLDVNLDVSLLRPKGTESKGKVASGPESFYEVYKAVETLAHQQDIQSLLALLSKFNEVIRRGGEYKNGAVTTSLPVWHPLFEDYLAASPVHVHPWLKKGAVVPRDWEKFTDQIGLAIYYVNNGSLWLEKAIAAIDGYTWLTYAECQEEDRLGHNVCLKGDTLVNTSQGIKKLEDLVNVEDFPLNHPKVFNGEEWVNGIFRSYGFTKEFIKFTLEDGTTLETTLDHRWIMSDGSEKQAHEVRVGDRALYRGFTTDDLGNGISEVYLKNYGIGITRVEKVTYKEPVEVFSGQVPKEQYWLTNGLITGNCREVILDPKGTCILMPINLGQIQTPAQLIEAFTDGMTALCMFQKADHQSRAKIYLPADIDRQVGLELLGLANFLRIQGISYSEFTLEFQTELMNYLDSGLDLNVYSHSVNPLSIPNPANLWAYHFIQAYAEAAKVAKSYGMKRAFAIAPTASVAYRSVDLDGYTCCPEISPPVATSIERISQSSEFEKNIFDHGPVETAHEVGFNTYFQLASCFQTLMDSTDLGHAISFNLWEDMTYEWFTKWADSPLKSTYYRMDVDQNFFDKSDQVISCGLSQSECQSCGN